MRIHTLSFIVSFCLGLCAMLCIVPRPSIVVKFPRPGSDDDEYRAPDGSCFKVSSRRVDCDKSGPVVPQPIAEVSKQEGRLMFLNPFSPAGTLARAR